MRGFTFVASWGVLDEAPVSWSFIFRALFNALVPDCSLRLNNLRIPSYVLIKQLILNQLSYSLRSNKVCWQIRAVVDLRQISAGRFVLPCLAPFWLQ